MLGSVTCITSGLCRNIECAVYAAIDSHPDACSVRRFLCRSLGAGVYSQRGCQSTHVLPQAWRQALPLRDDDCLLGIALAGNKGDGDAGSVPGLPEYSASLSALPAWFESRTRALCRDQRSSGDPHPDRSARPHCS